MIRVQFNQYNRVCEAVKQLNKNSLKKTKEKLKCHRKITNSYINYLLKEVSIMGQKHSFLNKSKINL